MVLRDNMCLIRMNMAGSMGATTPRAASNRPVFPCSLQEQNTPKVRKPYTITKQRERWTGDEHQKFLEAIKLHGRAWKSVEEHIGTKNTTQIRSHAQKFFTKVARELTSGNAGSVVVEVPPPRPKKKSTHPYPRKSAVHFTSNQFAASEGSSASVSQSITDLSESSCICGHISPVLQFTDRASKGGSWGLVSDFVELTPRDQHVEVQEPDDACVKSFQLFGMTIVVADVNVSSPVHPMQGAGEEDRVNATTTRKMTSACAHGLRPFFDLASDTELAAAPVSLAKLSIGNRQI